MDAIHIFDTPQILATTLAEVFYKRVHEQLTNQDLLYIAISGGSTPVLFFRTLADNFERIPWEKIHIFWVDERCVAPDNEESNYGMTKKNLLDKINIPMRNVHRIQGEERPAFEAERYAAEIRQNVFIKNNWPVFDWILLGLGSDGHTASLFPGSPLLDKSDSISAVANHPESGQNRITITFPVLNGAKIITFLVSGSSKKQIIREILGRDKTDVNYPASRINPGQGILEWYLDKNAAAGLS